MKVLHIHSGNMFGGVERFLVTLAATPVPGMNTAIALAYEGQLTDELPATGIDVHRLPTPRHRNPWSVHRARRALHELLREHRPDVVVCHAPWALALFGPVVRRHRVPLVFWMHGTVTGRHWLERRARRAVPDLTITNSAYTQASLAGLFPDGPSTVIRYPVAPPTDVQPRSAVRQELGTDPETVAIVQVSRLEPWKGQHLLIEALARIRTHTPWSAWMAGGAQAPAEQRYLLQLHSRVNALGLAARVRFLGHRRDVAGILSAADIFCQPNTGPEPFGITFVEALYAGLPVVTTGYGGAAEIVADGAGVVVPTGDPDVLAGALRNLVDDPAARAAARSTAKERARELCDPVIQVERIRDTLAQLVNGAS